MGQLSVIEVCTRVAPVLGGARDEATWKEAWKGLCWWPFDVFAVTSELLEVSGAYRFVVGGSAELGEGTCDFRPWLEAVGRGDLSPPDKSTLDWTTVARKLAAEWIQASTPMGAVIDSADKQLPRFAVQLGELLFSASRDPVSRLRKELLRAVLAVNAVADECASGCGLPPRPETGEDDSRGAPDERAELRELATAMLTAGGTMSRLDTSYVRVLPKARVPKVGLTMRSMTHHATAIRTDIRVTWVPNRDICRSREPTDLVLLLMPWPSRVTTGSFRAVPEVWGSEPGYQYAPGYRRFQFSPRSDTAAVNEYVHRALEAANRRESRVDGLIFPEQALSVSELKAARDAIFQKKDGTPRYPEPGHVPFLLSGVRGERSNTAQFWLYNEEIEPRGPDSWQHYTQSKHHRWHLDRSQLSQYGLAAELSNESVWWEDIKLDVREVVFVAGNGWFTVCALICEDLARQEPVAPIVRAVGPNLVVALLADGPQLPSRWGSRYATVLAEDPGSSVLTLTSLGMATLGAGGLHPPNRTIGLWRDATGTCRPLELTQRATAGLLRVRSRWAAEYTADGRHDRPSGTTLGTSGRAGLLEFDSFEPLELE